MTDLFKSIDLSDKRHVFAVGDIHGCFALLERRLEEIGFDRQQDALVSVGDLVDRGPESDRAVEFAVEPWFHFVRGNHEQMTQEAGGTGWHIQNGGAWFDQLHSMEEKRRHVRILNNAPIVLEVNRNGRKYGFVHAAWPADTDWRSAPQVAEMYTEYLMWDRTHISRAQRGNHKPITNVDHVFFGHTPLDEPLTVDNCSWIDTGAVFKETGRYPTGKLTIVNIDDYQ